MSISEFAAKKTDAWDDSVKLEDSAEIVKFLNETESLCTPGFLLRRQIQKVFPDLVKRATKESKETCADLTTTGNVSWPDKLLGILSRLLANEKFEMCSSLELEARHWKKYLSDEERCKRNTAIKLIFALEMNDDAATKFLLANGSDLLSLRNPFDYACKVALAHGFSYENAETLFKAFESKYQKKSDAAFTQLVTGNLTTARKDVSFEEIRSELLDTMCDYRDEFCFEGTGYSRQNVERLRLLLKYLQFFYPCGKVSDGITRPFPLVSKIMDSHQISIDTTIEVLAKEGETNSTQTRGHENYLYHNIPFTKKILLPLSRFGNTLSAILRAIKKPANARSVDRDTVLLLTYFLISGWHYAPEDTKRQFQQCINADSRSLTFALTVKQIIDALAARQSVSKTPRRPKSTAQAETSPLQFYKNLLNLMLHAFDFPKFYAPFVLDRFVLLALIDMEQTDEQAYNLMSRTIDESYALSKEILEGGDRTV